MCGKIIVVIRHPLIHQNSFAVVPRLIAAVRGILFPKEIQISGFIQMVLSSLIAHLSYSDNTLHKLTELGNDCIVLFEWDVPG